MQSASADLGKIYGEKARCPACGAFSEIVVHPDHRWVCAVCGAPRIQFPDGEPVPEETNVALREASQAKHRSAVQRLLSFGLGMPAALVLLLAIVLAPASLLAGGVLIGAGVALVLFALSASRRAATERKRLRAAVEHAYESAVAGMLQHKSRSASEIAAALKIPEAEVETMLTTISAQAQVRVALEGPTSDALRAEAEAQQAEAETDAEHSDLHAKAEK